jgi:hypothetical protein
VSAVSPFAFVPRGHPSRAALDRFRGLVLSDPLYARLAGEERISVRSLLKTDADGALRRVYVSFQATDAPRFAAHTFAFSPARGLSRHEFPADPELATLGAVLAAAAPPARILRYVPRRRATFTSADGTVGKVVRARELERAYANALRIGRRPISAAFRVARPAGVDRRRCVFFQEAIEGTPVSALADRHNLVELMLAVGEVQRELHRAVLDGLPTWDVRGFLSKAIHDVEWLASMLPRHEPLVRRARAMLVRSLPRFDPRRYVPCHGDLRPSHVLSSAAGYAVVDFDGAIRADPHAELARFLVFARREIPALCDGTLRAAAAEAFLAGYGPHSPGRLAWFLLAAELHFLTRSLQRDLWSEPLAEDSRETIEGLVALLRRDGVAA